MPSRDRLIRLGSAPGWTTSGRFRNFHAHHVSKMFPKNTGFFRDTAVKLLGTFDLIKDIAPRPSTLLPRWPFSSPNGPPQVWRPLSFDPRAGEITSALVHASMGHRLPCTIPDGCYQSERRIALPPDLGLASSAQNLVLFPHCDLEEILSCPFQDVFWHLVFWFPFWLPR